MGAAGTPRRGVGRETRSTLCPSAASWDSQDPGSEKRREAGPWVSAWASVGCGGRAAVGQNEPRRGEGLSQEIWVQVRLDSR